MTKNVKTATVSEVETKAQQGQNGVVGSGNISATQNESADTSSVLSGVCVICKVVPSCPSCPPGFLPVGLRRVLVRRMASAFMLSLEGGVLLLSEFLSGVLYLASSVSNSSIRLSRLRNSALSLSILRFNWHMSECCEAIVSRINRISSAMVCSASDMSVTFSFTGTKVRKISENTKLFHNYFRDILLIIKILQYYTP